MPASRALNALRRIEGPVEKALRFAARRRVRRLRPGVTIHVVNWNSSETLATTVGAVERYSSSFREPLSLHVLDNGSTPEQRRALGAIRSAVPIRVTRLPLNIGHAAAMNIGFLGTRTEFCLALDVDAFPIRSDWLDVVIGELRDGAVVAGAHLQRAYVHACFLAMRTADFVDGSHTFKPHESWKEAGLGSTTWDTAELISMEAAKAGGRLYFLEATETRGPGCVGTVFGDVVYHNFYGTRFLHSPSATLDHAVVAGDAEAAWSEAVVRFLT